MIPQGFENVNSFYYAIYYTIRYQLKNKKTNCRNDDELKKDMDNDKLYEVLSATKGKLRFSKSDTENFENKYFSINDLLNKYGLL